MTEKELTVEEKIEIAYSLFGIIPNDFPIDEALEERLNSI